MSSHRLMRIQKVLARVGVASRRHSEQMIREGRVTLAGQPVTTLGVKIRPDQCKELRIDGERLPLVPRNLHILLHKPGGFISSTSDPQNRPTVMDLLPNGLPRLFPVGRLDFHTEGLLLLTNDGPLAHLLLHPRFHLSKTYEVKVEGIPQPSSLQRLREGIGKGKEKMWAVRAEVMRKGTKNAWLLIEIKQGRYHQIRRMCEGIGHPVLKLKRISFGPLQLGRLPKGKWRLLKAKEVELLKEWAPSSDGSKKDRSSN